MIVDFIHVACTEHFIGDSLVCLRYGEILSRPIVDNRLCEKHHCSGQIR